MPDDPTAEPPTSTLISRVVSYSVAVLGGILIIIASFATTGGDWLALLSFRGLFAVPMWVVFAVGVGFTLLCVRALLTPARLLARRAREKREPQ